MGLRKLPATYGIDCLKGYFPHRFNTPQNQGYVGPTLPEHMLGLRT